MHKDNYQDFLEEIRKRGIEKLVHFTTFENITSMVGDRKILPRSQMHNISYQWREIVNVNSDSRYDDPNYLNTSISHPNIYLFNIFSRRKRQKRFVILELNTQYIYHKDTKFSISNATYTTSKRKGINGNIEIFKGMFDNRVYGRPLKMYGSYTGENLCNERSNHLESFYTTDEEAEVLIKCEIPYGDILGIALRNNEDFFLLKATFEVLQLPTEKLYVEPTLFTRRNQ